MAKLVTQSLDVVWFEAGSICNHIIVRRCHSSLSNRLTHKEEVVPERTRTEDNTSTVQRSMVNVVTTNEE